MKEMSPEAVLSGVEPGAGTVGGAVQWGAVQTLWWREIVRFVRQRSRITGAFAQPLVFWLLLGSGLNNSFRAAEAGGDVSYLTYFYPGVIALVLLFTAIFATIAVVEDRQGGFLQGVLVAPVSRASIVLGQSLGCTTLALVQGCLFLLMAPLVGIHLSVGGVLLAVVAMALIGFGLANLGLIIAWRMDSTQGFHAIMNLVLLPIWLLSGAFFPASGASPWLRWIMMANPLTYGMAVLRHSLYLGAATGVAAALPALLPSLAVTAAFAAVTFLFAMRTVQRSVA